MKKVRIAIVGYGNLGKAVERLCENDERFTLVGIFSHRDIKSDLNKNIVVERRPGDTTPWR